MLHQTIIDPIPVAKITKNKNNLPVYKGNIIYLNNKDNFEFELFNPLQEKISIKIKLNGKYISNSHLILNPGQRTFLERYIDSNNKFVFETYEVANMDMSTELAIALNGNVEIEFYKEYNPPTYLMNNTFWYNNSGDYNSLNNFGTCTTRINNFGCSYTSDISGVNNYLSKSTKETGIVGKGEQSKQSFGSTSFNPSYLPFSTIEYKIMPLSTMNTDEIKTYCTNCGARKKKTNWKFCPSCGTKI